MKMTPQQYCLRWKHHHSNVQSMFAQLLEKERFCDVTLYCSPSFQGKDAVDQNLRGVSLRAHRVVLAACSELLGSLLGAHEALGEPVLVVDGAEPRHLRALLTYMYTGEMSVHHSELAGLLKTAEELRIKGLTDVRWNNKDEPPDCNTANLGITATPAQKSPDAKVSKTPDTKVSKTPDAKVSKSPEAKVSKSKEARTYKNTSENKNNKDNSVKSNPSLKCDPAVIADILSPELRAYMKKEPDCDMLGVNGGPPPLIKLPAKDKNSSHKRDSESESPSPKRQRMASGGTEHSDDENSRDRDQEWQHGNMNITAERVQSWGPSGAGSWSRDGSDDEWADAPADIGSFLHTRLKVDGDNSADEDSNDGSLRSSGRSIPATPIADMKDMLTSPNVHINLAGKSGNSDPRFLDVVKLNDYLQHGRRPQFWEENYVKRVMEAVRLKQLEMKQAAEILGVSYGTLYGRYRDVYGCINRPYREGQLVYCSTTRDFWQAKGPAEVLERLQKGEINLETASQALGVTSANLAAYVAEAGPDKVTDFEPIPIEVDPALKLKAQRFPAAAKQRPKNTDKSADNKPRRVQTVEDDDTPAMILPDTNPTPAGKWPIRVANIDSLRGEPAAGSVPTSPSVLMRNRPDLTIVAAKRKDDDS